MYIISDKCVGCHNCAMECPMGAIHYVGLQYQIDQDLCIGCGHCEEVCHIHAAHNTDPVPVVYHEPVEKTCDVLVCGGGTGLISAVKAAQAGKKVILIEKAEKLGGNSDLAHGFWPIYTKWHQEAGLEDLREPAVKHFMRAADNELEEDVVRTGVYGCGEFFDWLCEQGDMKEYYELRPKFPMPGEPPLAYGNGSITIKKRVFENLSCRDCAIGPGWGYTVVKYTLLDKIREQNLDVEILMSTAAKHLLTNGAGKVTGVEAEDPGGKVTIHAGAVILATGGFGRSDEKLQKYFRLFDCETIPHRFSVPTDTGDAIDMLEELGVDPDTNRMFTPHLGGPSHHPYSFAVNAIMGSPSGVQLNLNGKRWRSEAAFGIECPAFSKQPGQICWTIYTEEALKHLIEDAKLHNPMLKDEPEIMDHCMEEIEEEIAMPEDSFPGPAIRRADTIRELAQQLKIDPDTMEQEINRYNGFCASHRDEDFGKPAPFLQPLLQGPYYAIYGQRFIEMAAGGLRVDAQCRVCNEDGTPFEGLYGVGDATSAMHRRDKYAVMTELTWAVASAYVSGKNAAAYVKAE